MYCEHCGNKIEYGHIAFTNEMLCSYKCHLLYWKANMPSLGGDLINYEDIEKMSKLEGMDQLLEYERIVTYVYENFDETPFRRLFNERPDNP